MEDMNNMNTTRRRYNTTGACDPKVHYMVDIQKRLAEIKKLVDAGEYFTINRARQYGKTTTLKALEEYLKEEYIVISLDFQMIGNAKFSTEHSFSKAFASYLQRIVENSKAPITGLDHNIITEMVESAKSDSSFALDDLFPALSNLCDTAVKPVVLIIDEVDSATNNQVFLDFLAQLRAYYLKRDVMSTFQSVILAGVYDVKNIRQKIRLDEDHKVNSPWNIASDFKVDMSFSKDDIVGMLKDYEADCHTGMNVEEIAGLIFEYTSGYPYLVSRICKLMDEDMASSDKFDGSTVWTKEGVLEAEKLLLSEKNTLFESLMGKVNDYPSLRQKLYNILFGGKNLVYNPDDPAVDIAMMFGFVKNDNGTLVIANRIFEMRLYNYFLTTDEAQNSELFVYAKKTDGW